MADEGIPLKAIARSINIPSTHIYETLIHAKQDGRLLELPRDDWPPGTPRDQRALQLSRALSENRDGLIAAVQVFFRVTLTQARLVLLLVQHELVPRERVGLSRNCFDVHIVHTRRALARHGLTIVTLWGFGYQLSPPDRRAAMGMILAQAGVPAPA